MIELILFNNVYVKSKDPHSPTLSAQEKQNMLQQLRIATVLAMLIYILIFVLAIYRAMACSNNNPDSRAIHLFFATVSPVVYILLSYFVPGLVPVNQ